MRRRTLEILEDIVQRLGRLEHEAELMRTILIVKEPNTPLAAEAYEGLRRQVVAAAAERRSHLVQLAAMATALGRATSVDDIAPQVREWMTQAGVAELVEVPASARPQDLFEDLDGTGLAGAAAGEVEVVEPAYLDASTGAVLRLGRARRRAAVAGPTPAAPAEAATPPDAAAPGADGELVAREGP
jgi:hypothetical protein